MEIDFTNCSENKLFMYGGGNGKKIGIIYDGETYMLKFPPTAKSASELSYSNSCISEYISCHIFESVGIETQKTLLGKYKDRIVVACKDFTVGGDELKDFASLKNTVISSSREGYGTELEDILETIREQSLLPTEELEAAFWDMFVMDAFLGNFDRHNGNWGFLVNKEMGTIRVSPIYDCGSCLYPQLGEDGMKQVLSSEKELESRIFTFPNSAIKEKNKKINYFEFLSLTENCACLEALKKINDKIDMKKIQSIIEETPYITALQTKFYFTMLRLRKSLILEQAMNLKAEKKKKLTKKNLREELDKYSERPRRDNYESFRERGRI